MSGHEKAAVKVVDARETIGLVASMADLVSDAAEPEKHHFQIIAEHMAQLLRAADVNLAQVEDELNHE